MDSAADAMYLRAKQEADCGRHIEAAVIYRQIGEILSLGKDRVFFYLCAASEHLEVGAYNDAIDDSRLGRSPDQSWAGISREPDE